MKEKERPLAESHTTEMKGLEPGTPQEGEGRPDRDVKAIMTPVWLIDSAAEEHKSAVCF